MPTVLGERLAAARKARGWSLRHVEGQTGIHNAHLSQIETGAIERPDPNILWTLAATYDLNFDELMRLAGHVRGAGTGDARRLPAGVAWRALDSLGPDEQQEVLEFMARLRKRQEEDPGRD